MSHEVEVSLEHFVTVTTPERGERDYQVFFDAKATIKYNPAYLGGSMEDGEPADGDCSTPAISNVRVFDNDSEDEPNPQLTDPALVKACTDALDQDDIEDALWEAYHTEHG